MRKVSIDPKDFSDAVRLLCKSTFLGLEQERINLSIFMMRVERK